MIIISFVISMRIFNSIVNNIAISINMSIVNRELPAAEIGSHNLARQCPSRQVSEENMELLKKHLS